MPLTDTAIRKAKPGPKPVKLTDGKGLYLLVNPGGSKLWRCKYRVLGGSELEVSSSPGEFVSFMKAETAKWRRLIQITGVKAD